MSSTDQIKSEYVHLVNHYFERKAPVPLLYYWMTLNQLDASNVIDRDWEDEIQFREIQTFLSEHIHDIGNDYLAEYTSLMKKNSWKGSFEYEEIVQILGLRSKLYNMWLFFSSENKELMKQTYKSDPEVLDDSFRELIERNRKDFNHVIQTVKSEPLKLVASHWWWKES